MPYVTIPEGDNPFIVRIQGKKYEYEAGATVNVPDSVAALLANRTNISAPPVPVYESFKAGNGVEMASGALGVNIGDGLKIDSEGAVEVNNGRGVNIDENGAAEVNAVATVANVTGETAADAITAVNGILTALKGAALMPYAVSYALTQTTAEDQPASVWKDTALASVVTAAEGYALPDTITLSVGGTEKTVVTDYTYDVATGAIGVPAAKVTGDIAITIVSLAVLDITYTLTAATATGQPATIRTGDDFEATITADTGYDLPETITVTIGGVEKTVTTDYTYSAETGAIAIDGAKVTGDIVITAVATESAG